MKILVTGGAGFIGSHVVDRYIHLGHEVVVLDNLSSGRKDFVNKNAKFYYVDICDKQSVNEIFRKEKCEVLNHHAAQIEVRKSVTNPIFDAQVNILGLINLLEAGRKFGLQKTIFSSSGGAIYGETSILPTPEDYLPAPLSPYGITKLASEYYLEFYRQTYGLSYIALRYGNVYGPRQNSYGEAGVIAIFTQKMINNEQPVINGDGKQTRDFVYVKDVVDANQTALQTNQSMIVNIGTSCPTSINTIFDMLVHLSGSHWQKIYTKAKKGEQRQSILDINRVKALLNWYPKTKLKQGLELTYLYFKNN